MMGKQRGVHHSGMSGSVPKNDGAGTIRGRGRVELLNPKDEKKMLRRECRFPVFKTCHE